MNWEREAWQPINPGPGWYRYISRNANNYREPRRVRQEGINWGEVRRLANDYKIPKYGYKSKLRHGTMHQKRHAQQRAWYARFRAAKAIQRFWRNRHK